MKRLAFLLALALPLFGLTRDVNRGDRIGVLSMSDRYSYGAEQTVAKTVQSDLRHELRARGFDAFDTGTTYDDLGRNGAGNADFYVEIVSSAAANRPVGGVGVGTGVVGVDVAVVVAHVAAELRLYDGRTLELLETYDLQKSQAAAVPAGIGLGGRFIWAYVALPFFQYGQYRAAAHQVAREAAERIARR